MYVPFIVLAWLFVHRCVRIYPFMGAFACKIDLCMASLFLGWRVWARAADLFSHPHVHAIGKARRLGLPEAVLVVPPDRPFQSAQDLPPPAHDHLHARRPGPPLPRAQLRETPARGMYVWRTLSRSVRSAPRRWCVCLLYAFHVSLTNGSAPRRWCVCLLNGSISALVFIVSPFYNPPPCER